ncbi:MAG: hypothetical protein AAF437_01050 [Pseudomonadota bacterium]
MRSLILISLISAASAAGLHANAEQAKPDMLAPIDLSSPEMTAHSMMRAMYQGNGAMIDQVFSEGAILRRVTDAGELRPDGLKRWRDWVDTLDVGDAHEEIFDVRVESFGTLATVWAPFVITFEGELVGCGVNQLTMANQNDTWKIVFGMDTNAPKGECATFKARHTTMLDQDTPGGKD